MKYLTIDTTTKVTALALGEDGQLVADGFLYTQKTHSERLIPQLEQLLIAAAWSLSDLDMIGVVRGPGSFTGIRIGIATAQGFAQVLGIPLVGVLSLDALAWAGCERSEDIVPILDARKNEWYTARYRWSAEPEWEAPVCLTPPQAIQPSKWLDELAQLDRTIVFAGDALPKAKELIINVLGERAVILPDYLALPRGAYAVRQVWHAWKQAERGGEKNTVEPYYIRLSEAEINWAKKEEARRRERGCQRG